MSFFICAIPAKAQAPIRPVEQHLDVKVDWVAYATEQALEAEISPSKVRSVIECESGWDSKAVGDHNTSFGLAQIHITAHPEISISEAEDPAFAIQFLVRNIKEGHGSMWSCY